MSEPDAKRTRYDAIHMRLVEDDRVMRVGFSYNFLPCVDGQCIDHGFFSEDRTHSLLSIELPGKQCMPDPTPEPQVHLACNIWVEEQNTVIRFQRFKVWTAVCRLLLEDYPMLRPARGALVSFGERCLVWPLIRVLDEKYGITVECVPGERLREERVQPEARATEKNDGQ